MMSSSDLPLPQSCEELLAQTVSFETVNLKVTGLVLGQIDAKGMKRYGYGGEYGAYGAYGAKYYHN